MVVLDLVLLVAMRVFCPSWSVPGAMPLPGVDKTFRTRGARVASTLQLICLEFVIPRLVTPLALAGIKFMSSRRDSRMRRFQRAGVLGPMRTCKAAAFDYDVAGSPEQTSPGRHCQAC